MNGYCLGLGSTPLAPGLEVAYNAVSVIEAARDIQLTGIHPRRSIRFVIFVPGDFSSFPYIQAHRDELDRASAAIILSAGSSPLTGFALNGRHDLEAGVREALKPIDAMGVTYHTFDAPLDRYSLGFLLQGIPTLLAQIRSSRTVIIFPPIRRHRVHPRKLRSGKSSGTRPSPQ